MFWAGRQRDSGPRSATRLPSAESGITVRRLGEGLAFSSEGRWAAWNNAQRGPELPQGSCRVQYVPWYRALVLLSLGQGTVSNSNGPTPVTG